MHCIPRLAVFQARPRGNESCKIPLAKANIPWEWPLRWLRRLAMILDSGDDPCRNYRTIHRVVPEPIGVDVQVLNTWVWVNTYRYIFSGMNIHKSQLFWGSLGTRVLTHPHINQFSSMIDQWLSRPFASSWIPVPWRVAWRWPAAGCWLFETKLSTCRRERLQDIWLWINTY